MAISKKKKEILNYANRNKNKKGKSCRHETTINDFTEAFQYVPDMVVHDQTASIHNDNDNLHLNENTRFISIICPICKVIQTQHRCLFKVAGSFVYDGENICGEAFCAVCGAS